MPDGQRPSQLAQPPKNRKWWLAPFRKRWLAPFLCLFFASGALWVIPPSRGDGLHRHDEERRVAELHR